MALVFQLDVAFTPCEENENYGTVHIETVQYIPLTEITSLILSVVYLCLD